MPIGSFPLPLRKGVAAGETGSRHRAGLLSSGWRETALREAAFFRTLILFEIYWQAAVATKVTAYTRRRSLLWWRGRASLRRSDAVAPSQGNGVHLKA